MNYTNLPLNKQLPFFHNLDVTTSKYILTFESFDFLSIKDINDKIYVKNIKKYEFEKFVKYTFFYQLAEYSDEYLNRSIDRFFKLKAFL